MQQFQDRVAVIIGAASGIVRGLARRCAKEGMQVVLADIEVAALAETEAELRALGAPVLAVVTDVAKAEDVEALARKTLETFGAVHLLCNNAGVGLVRSVWESSLTDWNWVLGVNLLGVIHGLRVFVPIMLEQEVEGHIVNIALSETLYHELAQRGAKVKVSVLLPAWVNTRIVDAERNRPLALRNAPGTVPVHPQDEAVIQATRHGIQQGISPDQVADIVLWAIRNEQLYVFTHPETKAWVRAHMEGMLAERNPPLAEP